MERALALGKNFPTRGSRQSKDHAVEVRLLFLRRDKAGEAGAERGKSARGNVVPEAAETSGNGLTGPARTRDSIPSGVAATGKFQQRRARF